MKTNPFYLTNRIPPQFFCDRETETKQLLKSIENQENVVLMAQRRIGKTGLINHCFDLEDVRDNYYTVSIDILHTSSLKEFVKELGNAAFATVAQKSEKLRRSFLTTLKSLTASIGYDPVTATPTFNIRLGDVESPGFSLDEIFAFLESADRPCIIAIDEFQRIANYPEKNVEELLRGKIQKLTNTHIIFAGSERRILSEMFQSDKRPFYQSATMIQLEPIDPDRYYSFAQNQFTKSGKNLKREAFDVIYNLFEGITLYVHRVLHDCFYYTDSGEICSKEEAELFSDNYINECGTKIKEILAGISESQKELLYAVSAEKTATGITSGAFIKRHNLKSASAVQSAAKALIEAGILTRKGYAYSLSDPMTRIWLEKR